MSVLGLLIVVVSLMAYSYGWFILYKDGFDPFALSMVLSGLIWSVIGATMLFTDPVNSVGC